MRILYDANALKASTERLFPASRHRSARVHKKLIRRHGGEFRQAPCIFKIGDSFVAHPSFRAAIEANTTPAPEPRYAPASPLYRPFGFGVVRAPYAGGIFSMVGNS